MTRCSSGGALRPGWEEVSLLTATACKIFENNRGDTRAHHQADTFSIRTDCDSLAFFTPGVRFQWVQGFNDHPPPSLPRPSTCPMCGLALRTPLEPWVCMSPQCLEATWNRVCLWMSAQKARSTACPKTSTGSHQPHVGPGQHLPGPPRGEELPPCWPPPGGLESS